MIKNIKNIFKTSVLLIAGSFVLWNCESEADNLGSQFFVKASAEGVNLSKPIIAYNISNNDSIRSDASKLTLATLGAFSESQFGLQKSNYITQARLNSYDPDFGTNAVVDSVVLEIKPLYPADSATAKTYEDYVYPDGNVAAKKVVNTYNITKYGNKTKTLTLNVHEVTDFLGSTTDKIYSNHTVNYGTLLASEPLKGTVSSVKITKDSDNSELFNRDAKIRIPLDKTYFQNKIIAKKGQPELSDASNFIRYFKGIRLSVAENDGYIFKFTPNDMQIQIYYKRDVTSNGTTTPTQTSFAISLGSGNVHYNNIEYNRAGTPVESIIPMTTPNYTTGDAKLYAQGMGGPSIGLRIPAATIAELRDLYKTNKIGILSAKIRLYVDSVWNNNYEKPSSFVAAYYDPTKPAPTTPEINERLNLSTFLKDYTAFAGTGSYQLVKTDFTKNPAFYDITITQTFKDIIEKSEEAKDIALSVGAYDLNPQTGLPVNQNSNSRAYTPNRIVLVGTDSANPTYAAQLNLIYATK